MGEMTDLSMLTEEERAALDSLARFCGDVLAPNAASLDENAAFAGCHLESLGGLGVMGLNLPEAYGGPGFSAAALFQAVRLLARSCASTASMVTAHYLATDALLIGGTMEQKERVLPRASSGEWLGAFALTEPEAGSNPADMKTRASRLGDDFHLRGQKQFISNGGAADFVVAFARTDNEADHRGISAFLIETPLAGFNPGPAEKTMGLKGGHVFPLSLDCRIPGNSRIGAEGSGFKTAMKTLDNGRLEVAAMSLGIADAAFEASRNWLNERHVSGRPIAEFQGLRWMLADMATRITAADKLSLHAVALRQAGKRFSTESAMAKLFASETAGFVCDQALQIHGGYGYSRDFPLERLTRDARILRIYEGSSEIQRNVIARTLLNG